MIGRLMRFSAITVAALAVTMTVSPERSAAQGPLLEAYSASLGNADHYNSRGARLTEPWQVIRQDRANFHRFGIRDPGDEYDSFFAIAANRNRMEQMILRGYIDANAGWRVVNENVWITVEIYQNSVRVDVQ